MATEMHFAPGAAADEATELEFFFLSSLTVLTGGDRNRSQLVYAPEPHLRYSISAVTLYCFISQDVKISLPAGERFDVYCSPVGNDAVSDGKDRPCNCTESLVCSAHTW